MEKEKKKLAVIFPGIGYHADKPLLYYARMLARACGYETVEASYGGFDKGIKGNAEKMRKAFAEADRQAEALLQDIDFAAYDSLLFLSKSIGTAVASAYAHRHGYRPAHIYFTPVEASFAVMKGAGEGIVFHGTADPWADTEAVRRACRELDLPLYVTMDANHSLETGDALRDLQTMTEVMQRCASFIGHI